MIWYCCGEHQKVDWLKHRAFCSRVGPLLGKSFPKFTFSPCPTSKGSNLLVLLHGFGDSDTNFSRFGQGLELPHTDLLALCGKYDLFGEGFCWYLDSEIVGSEFSSLESENEQRQSSIESVQLTLELFSQRYAKVFILGFSQGASLALATVLSNPKGVAGCIAFSPDPRGILPRPLELPLLITSGTTHDPVTRIREFVEALRQLSKSTIVSKEYVKGNQVCSSPAEVADLMAFLAQHLDGGQSTLQEMVQRGELIPVDSSNLSMC